jgi:hypothetical protein
MEKVFSYFLLLIFIILFSSCTKKDSNPNSPEDNRTVLAEANIGESGGTISSPEFSLTIPRNSLSVNTNIKLLESSIKYNPADNYSKTFLIKGLPLTYKGNLVVRVKYTDTSASKNSVKAYFSSNTRSIDSTITAVKYLEAKDSSGFLVSTLYFGNGRSSLLKNNSANGLALADEEIAITADPPNYTLTKTNGTNSMTFSTNPSIYIPRDFAQKALDFLCMISDTFYYNGFRYTARDSKDPFEIYIENNPNAEDFGYYNRAFPWTINGSYINIEYSKINSSVYPDNELKSLVSHEFFHFVHSCYGMDDKATWWYQDALCAYVEEKLQTNPKDFSSTQTATFYNRPFLGMEAGKEWYDPSDKLISYQRHGYGMGGVIKELFYNSQYLFPPLPLFGLVTRVTNEKYSPVEALQKTFTDFTKVWRNYFIKFFTGGIPNIKAGTIREEKLINPFDKGIWVINSATDTIHTFTEIMPDLSATVFRIHLNRDFTNEDVLKIYCGCQQENINNIETSVYQYRNANMQPAPVLITRIERNKQDTIAITGIKDIKDNFGSMLIVVTNSRAIKPFNNITKDINYVCRFTKKKSFPDFDLVSKTKWLTVSFNGTHQFKQIESVGGNSYYESRTLQIPDHYSQHDLGDVPLNWSGNTFTASFNRSSSAYPNDSWKITFQGTISQDGHTITYLKATEKIHQDMGGGTSLDWDKSFEIKNVGNYYYDPYAYAGPTISYYRDDSNMKNDITIKYNYTVENYVQTDWTKNATFTIKFKQQ